MILKFMPNGENPDCYYNLTSQVMWITASGHQCFGSLPIRSYYTDLDSGKSRFFLTMLEINKNIYNC